jgi:hypothetical protein
MSYPKLLGILFVFLFSTIGLIALFKGKSGSAPPVALTEAIPIEISLGSLEGPPRPVAPSTLIPPIASPTPAPQPPPTAEVAPAPQPVSESDDAELPDANRIEEFFNRDGKILPIVETITYKSRVSWQKGRPAWLSDYAAYYQTSRHFIARSLNGVPDYFKQEVAEGDRFNVLNPEKNFRFYLLIDLSRCKMWFYYDDLEAKERVLLKTYKVGLGRPDSSKRSGLLTPLGKYQLGSKIVIYKPKVMGYYNGERTEMIRIFGSRWIPFEKELGECSAPAKGFGIHGAPWVPNSAGDLVQNVASVGQYQSDGCIRLVGEDMEELFAIIITKPTIVELVRHFQDATPITELK